MAAAPPTPRDALFRGVFGDREHAFTHLRTLLPDAVARALESGSLEPLAETFVDGRLAERQCDLLYRVRNFLIAPDKGLPVALPITAPEPALTEE